MLCTTLYQMMASADSGAPPFAESLNHESNIDPEVESPWVRQRLNVPPEKVEKLFTVTLAWGNYFRYTIATNRWDIKHEIHSPVSRTSFTMNRYEGYPTLNTTMRLYKAAVELEKILLGELLPFAQGPFDIQVEAMERATFDSHYESTVADSSNKFTRQWLNEHTAGRVYDWITTIVPMFTRSWMPDDTIRTLNGFNPRRAQHQSAENALRTSNENLIFVVFAPSGDPSVTIVDKQSFLQIESTATRRRPCKLQGTDIVKNADKLLDKTIVIDLQLGFTQQVLVRKSLLSLVLKRTEEWMARVFCVFPSFDKFPGLWSDSANANVVSALHCNPDADMDNPTTFFETSGLTQSSGQSLHVITVDSCQSGEGVFRMRKGDGCVTPYEENDEKFSSVDSMMCCELHPRKDKNAQVWDEMRIFGNRTRDPHYQQSLLIQDAFEWFFDEFGIDGPISINTDFGESTDSEVYEMDTLDAFKKYMPNCSELQFRFKTEEGLDKAINCMEAASESKVVHNVTFFVSITPSPRMMDTKTLEMAKLQPQNKTHIIFTERGHHARRSAFMRLETWIQSVQNRQLDISFKSVPVLETDRYGSPLAEISYDTHNGIVGVFTTKQYTTISSRDYMHFMRRNHVEVTIDTSKVGETYETVVRFRAGTKHEKVPRSNKRKGKGKGKASDSGGVKRQAHSEI